MTWKMFVIYMWSCKSGSVLQIIMVELHTCLILFWTPTTLHNGLMTNTSTAVCVTIELCELFVQQDGARGLSVLYDQCKWENFSSGFFIFTPSVVSVGLSLDSFWDPRLCFFSACFTKTLRNFTIFTLRLKIKPRYYLGALTHSEMPESSPAVIRWKVWFIQDKSPAHLTGVPLLLHF